MVKPGSWVVLLVAGCGRIGFDSGADSSAPASPATAGWSRGFPTGNVGHVHDAVLRADGTLVFAGHFSPDIDVGNGKLLATGPGDLLVAARSAGGEYLWQFAPPGSGREENVGLAADDAGNVYVTGAFDGSFTPGDPFAAISGEDAYLISLDASGGYRWGRAFGGVGDDFALGVAVSDGVVCIAGQFTQSIDLGSGTMQTVGPDVFVAAFTTAGTPLWSHRAGGAGLQGHTDVAATADGAFAIIGTAAGDIGFGGTTLGMPADPDLFVVVMRSDGTMRWQRRYAEAGRQHGGSIEAAANGDLVVSAMSEGGLDFGLPAPTPPAGVDDAFVLRLDASGTPKWAAMVAAGPGSEFAGNAIPLADDTVLAVGEYQAGSKVAGAVAPHAGQKDLFVVQLDTSGTPITTIVAGSERDEGAFGIAADPLGGAIVGGHYGGTIVLGGQQLTATGYTDIFLLRLDQDM